MTLTRPKPEISLSYPLRDVTEGVMERHGRVMEILVGVNRETCGRVMERRVMERLVGV